MKARLNENIKGKNGGGQAKEEEQIGMKEMNRTKGGKEKKD